MRQAFDLNCLASVLANWEKNLARVDQGATIQGSPERSLFRTVVRDEAGDAYLVEQIAEKQAARKKKVAAHLSLLKERGVAVVPYVAGTDGSVVQRCGEQCWLLSPFIQGCALDRSNFWQDQWRGDALAGFLAGLHANARDIAGDEEPFSLTAYITNIARTISVRRPDLTARLAPNVKLLQRELFPVYERIPLRFCHGDPHPLNCIWGDDRIIAVIDWEFCGRKPALYDAALVIGCVGSEAPGALRGGFIRRFRETLAGGAFVEPEWFSLLGLVTLAVRFGWLAEWLRRADRRMIDFELGYMSVLREEC